MFHIPLHFFLNSVFDTVLNSSISSVALLMAVTRILNVYLHILGKASPLYYNTLINKTVVNKVYIQLELIMSLNNYQRHVSASRSISMAL
jgi:hypothetical protein